MNIYDCFLFRDELDMLELRLNVLDDAVDYFVLVESRESFQRKPKPLFYKENQERFRKWSGKIVHIIDNSELPPEDDITATRLREKAGRESIKNGISSSEGHDVIMVSDVDEIPNPCFVESFREYYRDMILKYTVRMNMRLYYYFFDCRVLHPYWWFVPMVTTTERLLQRPVHEHRYDYFGNPELRGAGWHFAYFGGVTQILNRFNSNSDGARKSEEDKDVRLIESRRKYLLDPNGKQQWLQPMMELEKLPRYVQENKDKYHAMGWFKEKP